jgi:hypothetical protein
VNATATYRLSLKSPTIRSVRLRIYGQTIPRGFNVDYIVACAHRGPSFLNWNWSQAAGRVNVTVHMITGYCQPGPGVAGLSARVTLKLQG